MKKILFAIQIGVLMTALPIYSFMELQRVQTPGESSPVSTGIAKAGIADKAPAVVTLTPVVVKAMQKNSPRLKSPAGTCRQVCICEPEEDKLSTNWLPVLVVKNDPPVIPDFDDETVIDSVAVPVNEELIQPVEISNVLISTAEGRAEK